MNVKRRMSGSRHAEATAAALLARNGRMAIPPPCNRGFGGTHSMMSILSAPEYGAQLRRNGTKFKPIVGPGVDRRRSTPVAPSASPGCNKQLPTARNALEVVLASVSELETRTSHEVCHGSRYEDFVWSRQSLDA